MSPLAFSLRLLQAQPDAKLVALARDGHEPAFEALVRRYRRQLLAYCRRVAPPNVNPEDAVQQTFLQAWVALSRRFDVRDARAWLYRIAHNVVITAARRRAELPGLIAESTGSRGADAEAEQRIAAQDALAGLAALPALQREVIVGTALDGLTHEEMARELGLSGGAVRGLIYRARSTLRQAAAALLPGPLVSWAVRTAAAPGSSNAIYEAVAGGGSAGLGGLLLKGGVIAATAGVIAGAAGITGHHGARPLYPSPAASGVASASVLSAAGVAGFPRDALVASVLTEPLTGGMPGASHSSGASAGAPHGSGTIGPPAPVPPAQPGHSNAGPGGSGSPGGFGAAGGGGPGAAPGASASAASAPKSSNASRGRPHAHSHGNHGSAGASHANGQGSGTDQSSSGGSSGGSGPALPTSTLTSTPAVTPTAPAPGAAATHAASGLGH